MQNLKFERDLFSKNINLIAGIDEVGRGALAGPMVVATVILNPQDLKILMDTNSTRNNDVMLENFEKYKKINDSKLLTPTKRIELDEFIRKVAIAYAIFEISNLEIDRLGISKCTQIGFHGSIKRLNVKPEHVLTDAFEIKTIAREYQTNIIGGDKQSITIAAASIIAKVYRDNLMTKLHEREDKYKPYEFDKHKGYGTKVHKQAINSYGLSDLHRTSFRLKS